MAQSQVKFNRVPEKVPEKVPGGFGAEPGQVQQGCGEGSGEGSGRLWCSQVRFNRVPEKVPGEGLRLGAEPSQVQQGSGEGSGRFWRRATFNRGPEKVPEMGGFGAANSGSTGFRRRFRIRSGRPWCRARSGSTGFRRSFRRKFQETLVQSQFRFNRVPEKVPEKVWDLVRSQVRFNGVPKKVPEKVWGALVQSQVRFNRVPEKVQLRCFQHLDSQHASERFVKIKRRGCWGYHRNLFFMFFLLVLRCLHRFAFHIMFFIFIVADFLNTYERNARKFDDNPSNAGFHVGGHVKVSKG